MEYIIGFLALLFSLFIAGFFLKKQHFKTVDRLELWKIDIMNRPVLDEMSKVKQLNMTGQTEELFERWRKEWDEIVTSFLPDIEEFLFDAEECIDKYKFKKAKQIQAKITDRLNETEEKIKRILEELHELVGSEEKNRKEIDQLKDAYREIKKHLLAHRHIFGKAEVRLEMQLDDVSLMFGEFDEKTEQGNYLEAREIVLKIEDELKKIKYKQDVIPTLLHECQTTLPALLNELREGFNEMEEQYVLNHIPVSKEAEQMEREIEQFLAKIEKTEIDEIEQGIEDVKSNVELLFDLLEKEVVAKQNISKTAPSTKTMLESALEANKLLKEELSEIQQIYHLTDKDIEIQKQTEKNLIQLIKSFEVLDGRIAEQKTAQTLLNDELIEVAELLTQLINEQKVFMEKLHALRKDEMACREKIRELIKKVSETSRTLSKTNIPGIPQDYRYLMGDAKEAIQNVNGKLEEKPLNIPMIQTYLDQAVSTTGKLIQATDDLIENAMLAEKVIQYGNRYRSSYPSVAKGLLLAESAFRSYDYEQALEQAATTIEAIEPGALKKIESLISE